MLRMPIITDEEVTTNLLATGIRRTTGLPIGEVAGPGGGVQAVVGVTEVLLGADLGGDGDKVLSALISQSLKASDWFLRSQIFLEKFQHLQLVNKSHIF